MTELSPEQEQRIAVELAKRIMRLRRNFQTHIVDGAVLEILVGLKCVLIGIYKDDEIAAIKSWDRIKADLEDYVNGIREV